MRNEKGEEITGAKLAVALMFLALAAWLAFCTVMQFLAFKDYLIEHEWIRGVFAFLSVMGCGWLADDCYRAFRRRT